MSKTREALDKLIECARLIGITQAKQVYGCYTEADSICERALHESIAEHSRALAEPEQEPVRIVQTHGNWYYSKHDDENACGYCHVREQFKSSKPCKPRLEPAPQPREWQELSDDELAHAVESARCEAFLGGAPNSDLTRITYKYISAALRAKNGG